MGRSDFRTSYDVVVIGGGPAGASISQYLSNAGINVGLFERTRLNRWRVGDALPPEIRPQLSALRVWEKFVAQGHPQSSQMRTCWGAATPKEKSYLFNPYGSNWHVDRQSFDDLLLKSAQESGVDVLRGAAFRSIEHKDSRWRLIFSREGSAYSLDCRFVVDASGQAASFVRELGINVVPVDSLWGMVKICVMRRDVDSVLLVEALENGWWYSAPVSRTQVIASFMTDLDLTREAGQNTWSEALRNSLYTRERLDGAKGWSSLRKRPALSRVLAQVAGPNWLAVGDSASSFDPLSGSGVYKALSYAPIAAKAIISALDGDSGGLAIYHARIKRDFTTYLSQRLNRYSEEHRWSDSVFWKRRQRLPSWV